MSYDKKQKSSPGKPSLKTENRKTKTLPGLESKATQVISELQSFAKPEKVKILSGFFKTGKGEYGEGDMFLGISIPEQRKVAKQHAWLRLEEIPTLITSKYHEIRMTGLLILCERFPKEDGKGKKKIHQFYLKYLKYVNNWDFVDLSARILIGEYLLDKDRALVYKLAKSKNLWEKRISILTTYAFIRKNQFKDTIQICEILVYDSHDLIQKAVGWMLREVGNRDLKTETIFLDKYASSMPRTTLRYAIEKFPKKLKEHYMRLKQKENLSEGHV
ncbi:DNA alkylation repair protein [Leptospira perolatii]|uniref:DNA alkylation repair protein n=1 Tax=Leptospira perolatii TaxID=2023191 RepID=A0A2M9ZNH2_9LEPT|nr:DNA alkylation repair protein [Leptospira perolatii]PJZ69597.1 DNA alkylation repair protein [Leptospira perolatii]PJZ73584.1 DNA alkylation repair protein [Leptospira perolatii]